MYVENKVAQWVNTNSFWTLVRISNRKIFMQNKIREWGGRRRKKALLNLECDQWLQKSTGFRRWKEVDWIEENNFLS